MARASKNKVTTTVEATSWRTEAESTTRAGVKQSTSNLYNKKWAQLCAFSKDETIQDDNSVINPNASKRPCEGIVGKIIAYFQCKVVELECDYGKVMNIISSLATV